MQKLQYLKHLRNLAGPGRWVFRALVLLLLAPVCGCAPPQLGIPNDRDRPIPANEIIDFDVLYKTHCAGCHGADGKLGPAPPLNDPIFLAIVPDKELLGVVTRGRPGTQMPAFAADRGGPLTDAQVKALAEGIKPYWQSDEKLPADLPSYQGAALAAGLSTAARERGEKIYAQACVDCHGADGKGGMAGPINDLVFLSLVSNQMLRRVIISGRPDLGMPDFSDESSRSHDYKPLKSEQIDDLVALLASWRSAAVVATGNKATQPENQR